MCLTSPEAQEFKMGPTKWMFVTNIGFYPCYKNFLNIRILRIFIAPYIVVMINESLNEVLQKSQMDFFVSTRWVEDNVVAERFDILQ